MSFLKNWAIRLAWIVNLSLAVSYMGLWGIAAARGLLWRADFTAFYTGWALVRDGRASQLYDFDLQTEYQQNLLDGRSFADGLLPFNNPPHVALLFAPLALLPLPAAQAVWTIGQLALLVFLAFTLLKSAAGWPPAEKGLALVTLLAFPPLFTDFMLGAFSLLLLLSLWKAVDALRQDHDVQAGFWLLAGTIKPQALFLLPFVLLAARRWRTLAALTAGSLALFVATGLMLGWQTWLDYLNQLLRVSAYVDQFGIDPREMYNLRGALALVFSEKSLALANALSLLALLAAAGWCLYRWRGVWQPESPAHTRKMALTLALGCLLSLHANPQDALLLAAPVFLFYNSLRQSALPRARFAAFALSLPLFFFLSEFFIQNRLGIQLPVVAMIWLILWIGLSPKHWTRSVHNR